MIWNTQRLKVKISKEVNDIPDHAENAGLHLGALRSTVQCSHHGRSRSLQPTNRFSKGWKEDHQRSYHLYKKPHTDARVHKRVNYGLQWRVRLLRTDLNTRLLKKFKKYQKQGCMYTKPPFATKSSEEHCCQWVVCSDAEGVRRFNRMHRSAVNGGWSKRCPYRMNRK